MAIKWIKTRWTKRTQRVLGGVVLATAVLAPSVALAATAFDDVPAGSTHELGIQYVSDKGITQGCDADSYCPGDAVNRAQMATFLFRASGNDPATPPSVNADTIDGLDSTQLLGGGSGPAGPTGPPGLANVEIVTNAGAVTAVARESAVFCPAGKKVIGGGAGVNQTTWYLYQSQPAGDTGWVAYAIPTSAAVPQTAVLNVYAICATVA